MSKKTKSIAKKKGTKASSKKKSATKTKATKTTAKKPKPKKLILTDIQGVGPKMADSLRAGGFKTLASLTKTTPEKLMKKVEGVGEVTASRIIEAAKKLIKKGPAEKTVSRSRRIRAKTTTTRKKKAPSKASQELAELATELQSDDEQVLLGAIDRLGIIEDPKATGFLVKVLKHPRYMVRIHAAAQLGERQDKKAIDPLIESLKDGSIFVRQTAAGALENIGGAKARKAIDAAESEGLLLDDLPSGRRLELR